MAIEQLRAAIVTGEFPLGSQLSEADLARRLGTSKTPVREALLRLQMEGLVRVVPQSGSFVFTMSAAEVRDLCEVRQTLEHAALMAALRRAPEALEAALGDIVAAMRVALPAGEVRRYLTLDTAYHAAIFAQCGNQLMLDTYVALTGRIAALRTHLATKPGHTERSLADHGAMLQALAERDGDALARLLDQHIERTRATYDAQVEDIAAADHIRSEDGISAERTAAR